MLLHRSVIISNSQIVIDDLKYTTIDEFPGTGRVGDNTDVYGNADSTSRTKDVIIEPHFFIGSTKYTVTEGGQYSFRNCDFISFVFIPKTVSIIRTYAFYSCNILSTIILPESIISIEYFGFYSLYSSYLTNFTFCGDTDSKISLGTNALSGAIKDIFVPSSYTGANWNERTLSSQRSDSWCDAYYAPKPSSNFKIDDSYMLCHDTHAYHQQFFASILII